MKAIKIKPQFTPGPWAASEHADSAGRIGVGQINNTFDIAKVFGQENARLIAAAPDMYEALTALIDGLIAIDDIVGMSIMDAHSKQCIKMIRDGASALAVKAISKANGDSTTD